jgi:hypothetical protein
MSKSIMNNKGKGVSNYPRGDTAKPPGKKPGDRPPTLSKGVFNDFRRDSARSAVMPPPTGDTQEPRLSKRGGKGLSKGRGR